ncbi:MAG: Rrf2 family transcriptional regulator [Hyphomicrobiales bacterium]|nr:Rrf2 family transcriptional regulator [Hyphomicrobiales bacterium]
MQLKNQVEWALHCCSILAGLPDGRYLDTKSLAQLHGVPKEYLSKALQALAKAGLVLSTLGPSGGYRLARAASGITFWDVVSAIEGPGPAFVCTEIRRNNPCRPKSTCDAKACIVARVMWEAEDAWREKLRGMTIAKLVDQVVEEVPADLMEATAVWVGERS